MELYLRHSPLVYFELYLTYSPLVYFELYLTYSLLDYLELHLTLSDAQRNKAQVFIKKQSQVLSSDYQCQK